MPKKVGPRKNPSKVRKANPVGKAVKAAGKVANAANAPARAVYKKIGVKRKAAKQFGANVFLDPLAALDMETAKKQLKSMGRKKATARPKRSRKRGR